MNLEKTWEGLPMWAKGGIAVATVGVTGMIGFTIYNKVKRYMSAGSERHALSAVDKRIAEAKKAGVPPPTLTPVQISAFVEQLKVGFGGLMGDAQTIYNVFDKMKNEADVLLLMKAYGTQTIFYPIGSFSGTLSATMSHDMDASSMFRKSLADINENLSKKGITITF